MRITDVTWQPGVDCDEVSAHVRTEGARRCEFPVWFRFPPGVVPPAETADPFVAAFLIPCMHEHEGLHIDAPVSPRLLEATGAVQDTLTGWYPEYARVSLTTAGTYEAAPHDPDRLPVGCCFSGGIDSWYTFLKHEPGVTHLVLIRGLDVALANEGLWREAKRRLQEAADRRGKTLVTVETNLRQIADKSRCTWNTRPARGFYLSAYLAGPLAASGLACQGLIAKLLLPSGYATADVRPWGSHPELDPLWSTERLEVIHDGCEANRIEKTAVVAEHQDALDHLRVCLENVPGEYNCSRCPKCYRTMTGLRVLGALGRAPTFTRPISLARLRRMYIPRFDRPMWVGLIEAAQETRDTDLARALEVTLGQRFSFPRWLSLTRARLARRVQRNGKHRRSTWHQR